MLRQSAIAVAATLLVILPAKAANYLVHYPKNECHIVSKDASGTYHEKHKAYYSYEAAEKAMSKDPYCKHKLKPLLRRG
jgi:hypothetical protein